MRVNKLENLGKVFTFIEDDRLHYTYFMAKQYSIVCPLKLFKM